MTEQLYQMVVTATAEVRDADGNLISQSPVELTRTVTADERAAYLTEKETQ